MSVTPQCGRGTALCCGSACSLLLQVMATSCRLQRTQLLPEQTPGEKNPLHSKSIITQPPNLHRDSCRAANGTASGQCPHQVWKLLSSPVMHRLQQCTSCPLNKICMLLHLQEALRTEPTNPCQPECHKLNLPPSSGPVVAPARFQPLAIQKFRNCSLAPFWLAVDILKYQKKALASVSLTPFPPSCHSVAPSSGYKCLLPPEVTPRWKVHSATLVQPPRESWLWLTAPGVIWWCLPDVQELSVVCTTALKNSSPLKLICSSSPSFLYFSLLRSQC